MVSFFTCQLFVKMFCLFADHRIWQEAGEPEVPARGRGLLETAQTAGSNQDCYMSENPTKCADKNQLSAY